MEKPPKDVKQCDHTIFRCLLRKDSSMEFTGEIDEHGKLILKCVLCGYVAHAYMGG